MNIRSTCKAGKKVSAVQVTRKAKPKKSRGFSLTQGVIIAEIEHHGDGDFKLEFVPAEGFGKGVAIAAKVAGAGLSGPVGYFVGRILGKTITNIWGTY